MPWCDTDAHLAAHLIEITVPPSIHGAHAVLIVDRDAGWFT